MKPISHNIKTTKNSKNTKKKDKILSGDKTKKTDEEIEKEDEASILKIIKNKKDISENMKSKLIMLNTLKMGSDKLKNHDMNKESNTLRNTYEPKYYEFYNLISDIISAKDSSLFINKLTEEDYKTYNIETNPATAESDIVYGPIKNFWLNAIENSNYFVINDDDKNILNHLINIHSYLTENNEDTYFKIIYYFEENDYFTDSEISKVYHYTNTKNGEDLIKVDFPKINWKEGKKISNSFFDMFDEEECKLEESKSEVEYIRNDFLPNILELYMNFEDDSEADDYDNYI
jgi:hypothetical protein